MIVLTGASGGIGQAILPSLSLIEKTMGFYNSHIPAYPAVESDMDYAQIDITEPEQIKEFIKEMEPNHITLIHLAAIKIDELAEYISEASWDKVFNVNVKGAFFLTQALIPIMKKERWGRIIWILSSGLGDVGTVTYSASKYALLGASATLSGELARYGVTSNCLQLGYFETGLWNKLSPQKQEELIKQIPSKRLCDPKNIVVEIKAIIDNPDKTGAVINIDGGV